MRIGVDYMISVANIHKHKFTNLDPNRIQENSLQFGCNAICVNINISMCYSHRQITCEGEFERKLQNGRYFEHLPFTNALTVNA